MKRIKLTAIGICLLATLSVTGCICPPSYYTGMSHIRYGSQYSYGHSSVNFDAPCAPCMPEMACDPCGPGIACGVIESNWNPCIPHHGTLVDCRTSFSNISNGVLLIGRGVLDITAKPFIVIGKLMSSGCQYEVIAHCPEVRCFATSYRIAEPCCAVSTSGCDSCGNGHFINNGQVMQYDTQSRATLSPPMPRRVNSIMQATYMEPTTSRGVRFVQPR